jgi:hypothetical protein
MLINIPNQKRRKPQVEVQGCSNNPLEMKEHKHLGHELQGPKNKKKHYLKRKNPKKE